MKRLWTWPLVLTGTLLVLSTLAGGQNPPPRPQRPQGDRPERFRRHEGRDPGRNIELVRVYALIDELNLSEEQCAKVFPILSQIGKERRQVTEDKERTLMELRQMVDDPNVMEPEIAQKTKAVEESILKLRDVDNRLLEALKPHLSVKQQAELILFQNEFDRRLGEIVGKVMRGEEMPRPPLPEIPDAPEKPRNP
jgi:Spy/CpxP family protein refolding chaperone